MDFDRPIKLAEYIVEQNSTIRKTAAIFNLSKSTVHLDVSKRLKDINFSLYKRVQIVLNNNFKQKSFRGGLATKNKYLLLKNKRPNWMVFFYLFFKIIL